MVKLSVIVPFYNVQQYAPDTLRSLRANAREDFEFILVDDCSRDETPDILARAERELPGAVLRQPRAERRSGHRPQHRYRHGPRRVPHVPRRRRLARPGYSATRWPPSRSWAAISSAPTMSSAPDGRAIHRVPHGRRGVVLTPRDAILPADRSTSVDYAYAWAGIYHRRLVDAGLLHFTDGLRTAEDRPWIWRLHREAESFAVVGLLGVFYRRGVASSLTQIGDVRQLDFIRAFDQVVEETARDREPTAAAEGGAHLLRDHGPPSRIDREVRTRRGPATALDERRRPEAHAAGRTRRGAGLHGRARAPAGCGGCGAGPSPRRGGGRR